MLEEDGDGLRQPLLGYGSDQGDGGQEAAPHLDVRDSAAHREGDDWRTEDSLGPDKILFYGSLIPGNGNN